LYQPRMMSVEKTCPSAALSTTNPIWPWPVASDTVLHVSYVVSKMLAKAVTSFSDGKTIKDHHTIYT
jgi:hypothetical protein